MQKLPISIHDHYRHFGDILPSLIICDPPTCLRNGWYGHTILAWCVAFVSTSSSILSPFRVLSPQSRERLNTRLVKAPAQRPLAFHFCSPRHRHAAAMVASFTPTGHCAALTQSPVRLGSAETQARSASATAGTARTLPCAASSPLRRPRPPSPPPPPPATPRPPQSSSRTPPAKDATRAVRLFSVKG